MIKKYIILFFTGIILSILFTSCSYFKINRSQNDLKESINNVGKLYKRFILHAEDRVFEINNIQIQSDIISGNLISNPGNVFYTSDRKFRYAQSEKDIKYEVHLYYDKSIELRDGLLSLPVNEINLIKIIENDTGKNIASFVGTTAGVLGLIAAVIAATKSSCPYVYVHDGDGFVFEGETYGGAVAANLARHDYMPLPSINAVDGTYRLRLNNELKEHQFTDLAELLVINHNPDHQVLLDKYGQPQLIENPIAAIKATDQSERDILSTVSTADQSTFVFDELMSSTHAAIMTFSKPEKVRKANLIIKAQNTMWFDYLYGEVISKMGSYYDSWSKNQAQLTSEEHLQEVLDGGFPLFIYLKKKGEWDLVDYLLTPGPLASREFVISMDLSNISGSELEVKIETGFMFWEMDYAKIDFTETPNIHPLYVSATSAIGSYSKDWTAELSRQDYEYMVQKNINDITEITFAAPPVENLEGQSVFLHTYGYYKLIREFEGMPRLLELIKFETPGHFSNYSKTEFINMVDHIDKLANTNNKKEGYAYTK